MATRDETIRYVYQVTGSDELTAAARAILGVGEASEETQAQVRKLADAFADASNATDAAAQYEDLAKQQIALGDAAESAGLKLKLASQQHASTTAALDAADAALTEAKRAQADYAAQTDRTAEKQQELKQAVKDAAAVQREVRGEWKQSNQAVRDATKGYDDAVREQQQLDDQLHALDQALSKAGVSTKDLGTAQSALAAQSANAKRAMDELAAAAAKQQSVADAHATLGTRPFQDIEAEIQKVRKAYDTLAQSGTLSAQAIVQAQEKQRESIQSLKDQANGWLQSLLKVKESAGVAGVSFALVVRGLGGAARAASEFERSMASIATLTGNAGAIPALSEQVRDLAREFGGDASKNAQALYDILSAGVDNAADAMGVLRTANELALGGMTDIGTAAKGVTATLNAYGLGVDRAGDVSDAFFTAAKAGATDIEALSTSIGRVAPVAATVGVSFDQLLAGVATLTNAGLSTDEAVTQMRSALSAVVAPSADAKKAAEELGIQFDAAALKSQGLSSFLAGVTKAAGGNTEVLSRLFGNINALQGVMSLGGTMASKYADALDQMANRAGSTRDAVATMSDTSAQQTAVFTSAINDLRLSFGGVVTALTPVVRGVTGLLNVFNDMPSALRQGVAGAVSIAAAFGSFGYVLSKVIGPLKLLLSHIPGVATVMARMSGAAVASAAAVDGVAASGAKSVGVLGALGGAVRALAGLMLAIPPVRILVLGGAAIAAARDGIAALGDAIYEALPSTKALNDQVAEFNAQARASAEHTGEAAARLAQYASVGLQSAAAVARMSASEQEAYASARAGLEQYLETQIQYYEQLQRLDALNADGVKALEAMRARLADVQQAGQAFADGVAAAAQAVESRLTPAAAELAQKFAVIGESSQTAASKMNAMFANVDMTNLSALGDIALAMQAIGEKSEVAGVSVRRNLGGALERLTVEDLEAFKQGADVAFAGVQRSGDDTAVVMDSILGAALAKLGVRATSASDDAVRAFQLVASIGTASAEQIDAAFQAALKAVSDKKQLDALGDGLKRAMDAGIISAQQYAAELENIRIRMQQLQGGGGAPPPKPSPHLQQLGKDLKDVGKDAGDTGEKVDEVKKTVSRGVGIVTGLLMQWRDEFRKTSDSAVQLFDTIIEQTNNSAQAMREFGVADAGGGFVAFAAAMNTAVRETKARIAEQQAAIADLVDELSAVGTTAAGAFGEFGANVDQTSANIDRMLQQVQSGKTQFDLLGKSDLEPLVRALEAARQRTQALQDQAKQAKEQLDSLNDSLQDQIDQARGDDEAVEDRRYQKQLDDAKKLAEQQGNLNSRAYQDAVRRINELHRLKLDKIRDEAKAQDAADADRAGGNSKHSARDNSGASGSAGSGTTGSGSGGVVINLHSAVTDPKTLNTFARQIKRVLDDIARRSA